MYKEDLVRQTDILSLKPKEASKRLHAHLTKSLFEDCFERHNCDNFMSWSSSLLFVIQYAILRSSFRGKSPEDIKICAVDTTNFSRGQFARDMWLMKMCDDDDRTRDEAWGKKRNHTYFQIRARKSPLPVAKSLPVGLGATEITVVGKR